MNIKIINSKCGKEIIVDDEDFDFLNDFVWVIDKYGKPMTWSNVNGSKGQSLRYIIFAPKYKKSGIYYVDDNPLNNQKSNLSYSKNRMTIYEDHGEVSVKDGNVFLFSLCDLDFVKEHTWVYLKVGYVATTINRKRDYFHRFIMDVDEDKYIDHINGNKLDNRRENLRICTNGENQANRPKSKIKNQTSIYKGVSKNRDNWSVKVLSKRFGTYSDEVVAANVYNYYASIEFGEFARLNEVQFVPIEEWEKYRVRKGTYIRK